MKPLESPSDWSLPLWHPDIADIAEKELENLREFSLTLLSGLPTATARLTILEPGLFYVQLTLPSGLNLQVYTVAASDNDSREFSVYFSPDSEDEEEFHTETVEDTVSLVMGKNSTHRI